MDHVELLPAYLWDCPACGRENFQRTVTRFLDPHDEADAECIAALYGEEMLEHARDGHEHGKVGIHAQSTPDRVTCRHCDEEFHVARSGVGDEDEEE